jgi:hypothetical protein
MLDTITLDGRKFTGISQALTANQDDYILAHLRLAGAIEVLSDLDGIKRTKEQRAEDVLTRILLSGRKYHVLAGCFIEDGKVWNRTEADANAARFAAITDAEEKKAMTSSIVEVVLGFFFLGAASLEISRRSSSRSAKAPHTRNAAPQTSGTSRH